MYRCIIPHSFLFCSEVLCNPQYSQHQHKYQNPYTHFPHIMLQFMKQYFPVPNCTFIVKVLLFISFISVALWGKGGYIFLSIYVIQWQVLCLCVCRCVCICVHTRICFFQLSFYCILFEKNSFKYWYDRLHCVIYKLW